MSVKDILQSAAGAGGGGNYVVFSHDNYPTIAGYPFDSATGYGARFADPAVLPQTSQFGSGFSAEFSSSGKYIAVGNGPNPGVHVYNWSAAGWGSKFANPASGAGSAARVTWAPDEGAIAVGFDVNPYITAYPWSSSGFGTQFTGAFGVGECRGVSFSPSGAALAAAATGSSPYLRVWRWSNSTGFGTTYSNPATALPSSSYDVDFHPSGNAIAFVHASSPYVSVYQWSDSTGFGAKYSNPATLPGNLCLGVKFSADGNYIALACVVSPYIFVYPWSNSTGFGAKYSNPATLPSAAGLTVNFSSASDAVFLGTDFVSASIGPVVISYPWSSSGFGAKYANPPGMNDNNIFGNRPANCRGVAAT